MIELDFFMAGVGVGMIIIALLYVAKDTRTPKA